MKVDGLENLQKVSSLYDKTEIKLFVYSDICYVHLH